MALVIRSGFTHYNYLFTNLKDPRSNHLHFIQDSPLPILSILLCYACLCKFGPILMQSRKPFELKYVMIAYNAAQVLANSYYGLKAVYLLLWKYNFNYSCQAVDYSSTEHGLAERDLAYVYFMFKLADLLDTVFIVLKKNNGQLSFLHCYHHGGILSGAYIVVKWIPGGDASILGIVNTLVHSIMYFYYLMTAFKPELKKSITWKKRVTQLQLAQFTFLAIHFTRTLLAKDCSYPKAFALIILSQNLFMLVLFTDFYMKVYNKGSKKKL